MQLPEHPDTDVDTEIGIDEELDGLPESEGPRRRGIYLLPNLFTTGGLPRGEMAIVAAILGGRPPEQRALFLAVDDRLNYEAVLRIIDLAKSGAEDLKIEFVAAN